MASVDQQTLDTSIDVSGSRSQSQDALAQKATKFEFRRSVFVQEAPSTKKEANEYISFSAPLKQDMTRFLGRYVTNLHEEAQTPGGAETLKAQPHAQELLRALGGDAEQLDQQAMDKKIGELLNKPDGWILTKTLLEQETAMETFAIGLMYQAEMTKAQEQARTAARNQTPEQAAQGIQAEQPKEKNRWLAKFRKKKPFEVLPKGGTAGAVEGAIAGGMATSIFADSETYQDLAHAAANLGEWVYNLPPSMQGALLAGSTAAILGRHIGKERKPITADEQHKDFQQNIATLQSIKNDPEYARYVKATIGIDVEDFDIVEKDGKTEIVMVDHPKSTTSFTDLVSGIESNLKTRDQYLMELGVPESVRDSYPEEFIIEDKTRNYERTGERVNKRILDTFNAEGGIVIKEESLPDFNEKNLLQDKWGQTSDSLFYGRMDGTQVRQGLRDRLRGKEFPPPFNQENVNWAQRDRFGNNEHSPFYGREEAPKFEGSNLEDFKRDVWGQKQDSLFYGILNQNELFDNAGNRITTFPDFDPDSIDPATNLDPWGQSRTYPDGSRNPFFGRANAREYQYQQTMLDGSSSMASAESLNYNDANIERNPRDRWGQDEHNPLYGRRDGRREPREAFNPDNIVPIKDQWGQTIDNPFFGRMQFDMRHINPANFQAVDSNGLTPADPNFGDRNGSRYPRDLDYGFFANDNPHRNQGRDRWKRLPSDPLFCYDPRDIVAITETDMTRDQWGQARINPDGSPNQFFGRINEQAFQEQIDAEKTITRFREAREIVLIDLTEKAIDRITQHEADIESISLIDEEIKARKEGGRIYEKKKHLSPEDKAVAARDIENLQGAEQIYSDIEQSEQKQIAVSDNLTQFLENNFGSGVNAQTAVERLHNALSGGSNITIIENGTSVRITSPEETRTQAEKAYAQAEKDVREENLRIKNETPEAYEARIQRLLGGAERTLTRELERANRDAQQLSQIYAQINALQHEESEAFTQRQHLETRIPQFADAFMTLLRRDPRLHSSVLTENELRIGDVDKLLAEINKLYEAGREDGIFFGWPERENNNERNRIQLFQAIVEARARQRANPNPPTEEIRQQFLVDLRREREYALEDAEKIDLSEDITKLEAVKGLMMRQGTILGSRTKFLTDIDTYIPVEGDHIRLLADLPYSERQRYTKAELSYGSEVSQRDRDEYYARTLEPAWDRYLDTIDDENATDRDKASALMEYEKAQEETPEEAPSVAYFQLLDLFFDYQSKTASERAETFKTLTKILPPTRLAQLILENAEAVPSGNTPTEFLVNLNRSIKSGQISRTDLRRIFTGIIDTVQARALAGNLALAA